MDSFWDSIFRERSILLSWNFQNILLANRSVYGQNLRSKHRHPICWYMSCYRRNFSKMPIIPDRRPKRTYSFGVFHISLESILCTESELKSDSTIGNVSSWVSPNVAEYLYCSVYVSIMIRPFELIFLVSTWLY
jgi:hypothetical protein